VLNVICYSFVIEAALGIAEENLFTLFFAKKVWNKKPARLFGGNALKLFFDIKLPHILY
jgi:hypothetical protein